MFSVAESLYSFLSGVKVNRYWFDMLIKNEQEFSLIYLHAPVAHKGQYASDKVLVWLSNNIWSPLHAHLSDVEKKVWENTKHLNFSLGLSLILCATTPIFCGMNINITNAVEEKPKVFSVIPILYLLFNVLSLQKTYWRLRIQVY